MARSTFFKFEKQAARHDRVILLSVDMPAEGLAICFAQQTP
jgi:hypothetical protein